MEHPPRHAGSSLVRTDAIRIALTLTAIVPTGFLSWMRSALMAGRERLSGRLAARVKLRENGRLMSEKLRAVPLEDE